MNLQDILTLVSGPQGWLLIGGGFLLLLVWLVYRRLGKLAATTRKDLDELRVTMAQLSDRLDKAPDALPSVSAAVGGGETALTMTESEVVEVPDQSVDADTYAYQTSTVTGDDTALADKGGEAFTTAVDSELPEELQAAGEGLDEPSDYAYAYQPSTVTEDDAVLADEGGDDLTTAADSELPEELQDAGEALDDLSGYAYETSAVGEDDTASTETGTGFMMEFDDGLPEAQQEAADLPEDSSDYVFGFNGAMSGEDDAESTETAAFAATEVENDLMHEPQDASGDQEVFGEFQFGAAPSLAETDEDLPADAGHDASEERQTGLQPSEEAESFVFGDRVSMTAGEDADVAQPESPIEPFSAVQSPSADSLEPSVEVPRETETDATRPAQSVSQEPSSGPASEPAERPQVGVTRCGECGRKIAYPVRLSGKRMRCPACRSTSTLP